MGALSLPAFTFAEVSHVGLYPAGVPGRHGPSQEGCGLSVSRHPAAWIRIAKLGNYPTLWLARRDGQPGRFVDGHAIRAVTLAWGVAAGLVVPVTRYRVCHEDDELARMVCLDFDSEAEAEAEREGMDDHTLDVVAGHAPAEPLLALIRHLGNPAYSYEGELVNRYVAAHEPTADGVWWDDDLAPERYSAPRGVILPEHLAAWQVVNGGAPKLLLK